MACMRSIHDYFRSSIARGLVLMTEEEDVFYTPASLRKRWRAQGGDADGLRPIMDDSDFLYGSYRRLKTLKRSVQKQTPGIWEDTDIHHIVENHHLQYLGRVYTVDEITYERLEPCVLFVRSHHNLVLDGAIGDAERYVLESKPFDFVQEFKKAHGDIKLGTRTKRELTLLKTKWLTDLVNMRKVNRSDIQKSLIEIYQEAYQEADMRSLAEIARSVIQSFPL
jgi:hypothetical protein